jgi:NADH-quinone oxidoreductase subunit J
MIEYVPNIIWFIAVALTLGFAAMVVIHRNPVASALSLVVSFVGLAVLFVKLDAKLLGILQILVYAGAVMVLFLFIIMLLDLKAEERRGPNRAAVIGGTLVGLLVAAVIVTVVGQLPGADKPLTAIPLTGGDSYDDITVAGKALFTTFTFHVQVMGLLLLAATLGVVGLSHRVPEKR